MKSTMSFLRAMVKSLMWVMLAGLAVFSGSPVKGQVTGLSDWTLYIDQGHAQTENMGLFGYSEAEKVLRVGLALRHYLLEHTDIEAVFVARETDQDNITLTERVDEANTLGVDFYYSIHSDAGAPESNRTLMLYGGWRSNGVTVEKTPQGGKAYGDILNVNLPGAMRIPTSGNYADRVFYQGEVYHHDNQFPYLYVNRVSTMASLLSEGGFHTNPTQQQRNMNAEWKKLEALAALWTILDFHDVNKPPIGVATGIIRDIETQKPLNGITVTIGEEVYVTDSYESLFNQYSNNPDELSNGFYFIEDLEPLNTVEVVFSSEDYNTHQANLTIASNLEGNIAQNLSFLDVQLTSSVPPVVTSVEPAGSLSNLVPGTILQISFSRKMNQASVEEAISMNPPSALSFSWQNEFILRVNTSQLEYVTPYVLTIDGTIAQNLLTGQYLDGDGDGTEGGDFTLDLTTSEADSTPPQLIAFSPSEDEPARELRPIIRLLFDEPILDSSIASNAITLVPESGGDPVPGVIHHKVINGQSILHFFPIADLDPGLVYIAQVAAGLSDDFNNLTEAFNIRFYLLEQPISQLTVIDSFDAGIVNWWHPQQAGQTTGIITELTGRYPDVEVVNHTTASTGSMRLDYAWDTTFEGTPFIRLYLPATASQNNNRFNIDDVLQIYLFGDGSGNEFRFMIRDGLNQLEGSSWITVNWVGWKLLSWDLTNDPVLGWVSGNGILEGQNFYFDSFHLRYAADADTQGSLYIDDLRFVKQDPVAFPTTLFESFEGYEDFSTDLFPWITIDVQEVPTHIPDGFTFPGAGTAYAFKVLNPAMTEDPILDNHPAFDGEKYLIAMQSQIIGDNKWLISPQMLATQNSLLKFNAKSISDQWGLERFRVLVMVDDNPVFNFNPGAFETVSPGDFLEAPTGWTPFSFFLGDYAGQVIRFAIQYVSNDSHMFMLDQVEVIQEPAVIAGINPVDDISVSFGTSQAVALGELQPSTTIMDSFGNNHLVGLSWNIEGYDAFSPSTYLATATFALPTGVDQSDPETPLQVTANVTVRKPFLQSILPVDPLEVSFGSPEEEVLSILPETTILVSSYPGLNFTVSLDWSIAGYDAFAAGDYAATGLFDLPAELDQANPPLELKVTTLITVHQDDTSVPELSLKDLQVYPNPARDELNVESLWIIRSLQLIGLDGRIIMSREPSQNHFKLSLSGLEQGLYLLRIHTEQGLKHTMIQVIP
ncbi:MAG: T9SS type A sorting domain-containing protein [Bacteroidales bacterium]|nr:T9SS type A sorting domain-containing protein [Bacteroidales bacterium]